MFTIKFHASRRLEPDELLAGGEKLNNRLQDILDKHTDPWGIKVAKRDLLGEFLHHDLSDPPRFAHAFSEGIGRTSRLMWKSDSKSWKNVRSAEGGKGK